MELPDTSVWIDYFRTRDPALKTLLDDKRALVHPYVIGELAMGQLQPRPRVLLELRGLPQAVVAKPDEVLAFVEREKLYGIGVGYVDAHLLLTAFSMSGVKLWTRDKRLKGAALKLGVSSLLA